MRRHVSSLFAIFSLSSLLSLSTAQRSFANTKFDLSPDLPVEDPRPPLISASEDESPKKFVRKPPPKAHRSKPVEAIAPQFPTHAVVSVRPPVPVTVAPVPSVTAAGFGQPLATLAPFAPATFPSPPHFLPSVHTLPPAPVLPSFTLPTIPPVVPPAPSTAAPQVISQPQVQNTGQFQTPIRSQQPIIQLIRVSSLKDRVELWFRDDFDLRQCPADASIVADAFRRKFPRNLLRNGKEGVLAELLGARLKECTEKQRKNHWSRVHEILEKTPLPSSEAEECRSGLVQEQISCLNVQSYSCQFIQPSYQFRLLPTRIIVQEARLAEDGSDRCRKVVRKVKKQLE